jgi:hypothetical protein
LLKFLPTFAGLVEVSLSTSSLIYAALAILIVFTLFISHHTLRVSLVPVAVGLIGSILFILSGLPHFTETFTETSMTETLPTLRGLFLYVSLCFLIQSIRSPKTVLWCFFGGVSVVQIISLLVSWRVVLQGMAIGNKDLDVQRIQGMFGNAWTVVYSGGCYLGICVMISCTTNKRIVRATCLSLGLIGIICSALSISRTAVVGIPIVVAGWIVEYCAGHDLLGRQATLTRKAGTVFAIACFLFLTAVLVLFALPDVTS